MSEPWFNPGLAWVPGTVLGCVGGLWGGLAGTLAPQGKARTLIVGTYWGLLSASVVFLAAGLAALAAGQPYGVWYGLGLAGVIGVIAFGVNGRMVFRSYCQAEERRIKAHDLGG